MALPEIIHNIVQKEISFQDSKSWGHGGQNINSRNTKVALVFNVQKSQFLDEEQKKRLIDLAGKQIHHDGSTLIMVCQEERYQYMNKKKVIDHFAKLLTEALVEPEKRIAMDIPQKEREARILDKKFQGQKKQNRQKYNEDDEV